MLDDYIPSQGISTRTSRLSTYSNKQHFDFLDTHHSVFSRNSYYHDMFTVHPWSRRPCSRSSGITFSALRARPCSARLVELARPKIKREQNIRQEFFDNFTNYSYSGVKPSALTAECSGRLTALAQPKRTSIAYLDAYTLPRIVPKGALEGNIPNRVNDLAKPRHNIILLNAAWNNKQK